MGSPNRIWPRSCGCTIKSQIGRLKYWLTKLSHCDCVRCTELIATRFVSFTRIETPQRARYGTVICLYTLNRSYQDATAFRAWLRVGELYKGVGSQATEPTHQSGCVYLRTGVNGEHIWNTLATKILTQYLNRKWGSWRTCQKHLRSFRVWIYHY